MTAKPAGAPTPFLLQVQAPTLEVLFVEAAQRMVQLAEVSRKPTMTIRRPVDVRGEDYPTLLLAWLRELLTFMDFEDRVFTEFEIVQLSPIRLHAHAVGGIKQAPPQHKLVLALGIEIFIRQTPEGYWVEIPFTRL
jgi:SHS2 domain-containing protein